MTRLLRVGPFAPSSLAGLVGLAGLLGLAGCGGVLYNAAELAPKPHDMPSRPPAAVDLYVLNPPTAPFVSVALLEVSNRYEYHPVNDLIVILRRLAGERGCEGLYITTIHQVPLRYEPVSVQGACMAYTVKAEAPSVASH